MLLGLALLTSFVGDMVGFIGGFILRMNMNTESNILALIGLSITIWFYKTKIRIGTTGKAVSILAIVFILFGIVNLIFIQGHEKMNLYTLAFGAVSLILISLVYFYLLIKELPTESITRLPMFWINTAILIYYSGTFFQYLLTDYLINVLKGDIVNTWTIHNFLGFVFYVIVSVGLWLNRSLYLTTTAASV
ncbi:MAG: hypothetical protein WDO15_12550 [Bacteroidota bacterium]